MSSRANLAIVSNRDGHPVDAAERDLRVYLFRGLALWLIFLDHIPAKSVSWITIRNYGFSDAAEIFIFISGYTAALVYGRSRRDHGFAIAAARILRRAWQVYAAHVFLFAVFAAEVMYVASAYDSPIFAQKAQIMIFLQLLRLVSALLRADPVAAAARAYANTGGFRDTLPLFAFAGGTFRPIRMARGFSTHWPRFLARVANRFGRRLTSCLVCRLAEERREKRSSTPSRGAAVFLRTIHFSSDDQLQARAVEPWGAR